MQKVLQGLQSSEFLEETTSQGFLIPILRSEDPAPHLQLKAACSRGATGARSGRDLRPVRRESRSLVRVLSPAPTADLRNWHIRSTEPEPPQRAKPAAPDACA